MSRTFDVAVVGATGAVGECMLQILAERRFPVGKVYALASERSIGRTVQFGRQELDVENLADFDFEKVQIGLFSPGASVSAIYAPRAADAGCVVIDNTSQFRYDDDIPLVVPEVNAQALADYRNRNIIANPNCSTIQMLVALKPIYDAVGIERINVATYQAVSGTGKEALEELASQTANLLNGRPVESKVYPKQIAFNVLAADRCVHGQRLYQGRDEDGLGDPQDHGRSGYTGEPDLCAGAGVLRALRGRAYRDP